MRRFQVICIFVVFCFLTSCSPVTRVSGSISDLNSVPLEGVRIKVIGKSIDSNANLEQSTKSDGQYNFGEIYVSSELPVEIKLVVTKDGFKPITKDLKYGEDNIDKIMLEREGN